MVSRDRQRSLVETLITLREDDPEFRYAISALSFRAGQIIAESDVLHRNIFILMKGRIQLIYDHPKGRRLALAILNPGAVIGEGARPKGQDSAIRAKALTDCVTWMVPEPQAQALVVRYPALRWGMLQTVGERLAQVENRMEEVAYQRLPARLASLLLDLSDSGRFIQGISHQTLADMLGTYRETISAILRSFNEAGMLALGYRTIELRDTGSLRMTADQPVVKSDWQSPPGGRE